MLHGSDLSTYEDDGLGVREILQGLISPAPAQSLVAPPPDRPAWSGPGESTPLTGNLKAAPSQATPKVSFEPQQASAATASSSSNKVRRGLGGYISRRAGADTAAAPPTAAVNVTGFGSTPLTARPVRSQIVRSQSVRSMTKPVHPIGRPDPTSGRVVTQPTGDVAMNQALATEAMRSFRSGLQAAIGKIPGARLAASRDIKHPRRLTEKIVHEGQPPETVNDYGAAQITVDSPQARDAVVAAVRKQFPIVRETDHFTTGDPEYGYRSYSMQVQMPNAASEELQIIPREISEANPAQHKHYRTARKSKLDGKSGDNSRIVAKRQNDTAMAKFHARNEVSQPTAHPSPLSKGASVILSDGSRGTVSYLDPQMKIARVRTESGRNLTLRLKEIKRGERPE